MLTVIFWLIIVGVGLAIVAFAFSAVIGFLTAVATLLGSIARFVRYARGV
jgi:hypothetical protein